MTNISGVMLNCWKRAAKIQSDKLSNPILDTRSRHPPKNQLQLRLQKKLAYRRAPSVAPSIPIHLNFSHPVALNPFERE